MQVLPLLETGQAVPVRQDDTQATYASKIEKADCVLDFSRDANAILWQIRGLFPYPLAMTRTPDGKLLKVLSAKPAQGTSSAAAGTVTDLTDEGFYVACGDGQKIWITGVLPEGKSKMRAADFVRGRRIQAGDRLAWTR